jgi:hypothetical protein
MRKGWASEILYYQKNRDRGINVSQTLERERIRTESCSV